MESTIFAKLGNFDGELLTLSSGVQKDISTQASQDSSNYASEQGTGDQEPEELVEDNEVESEFEEFAEQPPLPAQSVIRVNVTLDSSLDTEKLERQLALLRKYGAI